MRTSCRKTAVLLPATPLVAELFRGHGVAESTVERHNGNHTSSAKEEAQIISLFPPSLGTEHQQDRQGPALMRATVVAGAATTAIISVPQDPSTARRWTIVLSGSLLHGLDVRAYWASVDAGESARHALRVRWQKGQTKKRCA